MSIIVLPGADLKLISYRDEAGMFDSIPLGWLMHTPVCNGPLYNFFNGLKSPDRKFTSGWIGKDGYSQQYTEVNMKSWGNSKFGNATYRSFEFEGFPNEPLTEAQIQVAALWHNFLHDVDALANANGQRGIGIHSMVVATACPGTLRANQRTAILDRAALLDTSKPLPIITKPKPPVVVPIKPVVVPKIVLGKFPLPSGHCFGPRSGPVWQHSGYANGGDKAGMFVWQRAMKVRGWNITVDGYYGSQTEHIARQFQSEKRLTVDGLIGVGTWDRTKIWP
jgi:peptidoglycan hydrolase-like protein with peptidoglycan-binding domain